LRVIPTGERNDARAALRIVEAHDAVVRAAKLERAHPLKVLALEEYAAARACIERA
jgi:hypothetical protein